MPSSRERSRGTLFVMVRMGNRPSLPGIKEEKNVKKVN